MTIGNFLHPPNWDAVEYPKQKLGQEFIQRIAALQSNLENHRQQNFIGSMLMHHSMRSTEFMSRWIEAKNAKPI